MKFWKDKYGNWITFNEFLSRFKQGVEGITPKQQIKTQLFGTRLILLGLFLGFIISLFGYKTLWWLSIILLGGIINTIMQYLGLRNQYKSILRLDEFTDEVNLGYLLKGGDEDGF